MDASGPSPRDVAFLLDELCADLGFCLRPEDRERLAQSPPGDVDAFTDMVFRLEGLDPHADELRRGQVRERVSRCFERRRG